MSLVLERHAPHLTTQLGTLSVVRVGWLRKVESFGCYPRVRPGKAPIDIGVTQNHLSTLGAGDSPARKMSTLNLSFKSTF